MYKSKIWYRFLVLIIIGWIGYNFQPKVTQKTKNHTYKADTIKANAILKEVDLLFEQSKFDAAIKQLDNAISLFSKHEDWENVVDCTIQQAVISDNIDYNTKKKYAEKSLELAKEYLGKNHLQLGYAYNQIGELKALEENYDSSVNFFDKGLEIFKFHKSWESYTWAIISQGISYYYNIQDDEFKANLLIAQEYYKKYKLDEEIYIAILDLFGVIYFEEDNYDKAIENTLKSLDFYLKKPNLNHIDSFFIADNYHNLGISYSKIQAYQKATNYFTKAMNYSKETDKERYVQILIDKSEMTLNSYDIDKSINLLTLSKKELTHLTTINIQEYTANVNNKMGFAYLLSDQLDSSAYYYKLALSNVNEKNKSTVSIDYCSILLQTKQPLGAIALLDKVNISDIESNSISKLNRNYGIAYGALGDFEKSMAYFQKALHNNCPTFTDTLNSYANPTTIRGVKNVYYFTLDLQHKAKTLQQFPEKLKNLENALETYELSLRFVDTLRTRSAYNENRIINKQNQEIYERTIDLAHLLYKKTKDEKYIHKAFALSEKFKSNILLSSLNDNQALIPQDVQEQEQTLAANTAFYERQLQQAKKDKNEAKVKMYESNLTNYRLELINLKDSIKAKYPKYHELKSAYDIASISTIQKDLAPNQGFVAYYSGDSTTYVFTISKDDFHFTKLNSTSTIDKKVIAFRQTLGQPNSTVEGFAEYNETATDLYTAILQQSVKQLPKSVNQLTIIPDGTLSNIPFEILTGKVEKTINQDFSKLPYLLYDYQIHYAYSATLLKENERTQNQLKTNDECLAYAPPYESDNQPIAQRRGTMQTLRDGTMQLQGTGKEIQAIATHFDGDFDQSETATKANFVEQAPNFGILHLAMHGEANFENENLANLKFTNTKTQDKEQYLLYQNEIVNMDLNAQLVVLSACETGLGKYIYGEGIASLGRSFMYAGVPSIVMSLWKVDDKATSRLMPYFYENLAQGMNKDEALYQAKLTFLKQEDFSTLHPHYWAGFVSIGDTQPIKKGRNWRIGLIFGASLLLFGSGFLIWRKQRNIKK